MPERLDKLREMLSDLDKELDSLESLDEPTRTVLEEAKRDIEEALEKHDSPSQWEPQSIVDRLNDATEQFEVTHPTLTGIIQRMINALSQLGI